MAPTWQLLEITTENRPVRFPNGEVAPADEQPTPGATIKHWCDPVLAGAWLRQARVYLNDLKTKQRCDRAPNFTNLEENRKQAELQRQFTFRAADAFAQYCNAMNLVAMNIPFVRRAYHKWISGLPYGSTEYEQLQSWFKPDQNFGGGNDALKQYGRWSLPNHDYPVFGPMRSTAPSELGVEPGGLIGKIARTGFQIFDDGAKTHPSLFLVNVGINLRVEPGTEEARSKTPEYQRLTRNIAEATIADPPGGPRIGSIGIMPTSGTRVPSEFWDWRAVFFLSTWGGIGKAPVGLVAPMRAYLDFLHEIVSAAGMMTSNQVIQDTRAYVAWMNTRQIIMGYGRNSTSFLNAVTGVEGNIVSQQIAEDPGLRAASSLVGSVGAGIGAALASTGVGAVAGGVIALVSGVVSSIIRAVDLATPNPIRGKGKDDLGRYKPVLARGVLSGDVSDERGGQPSVAIETPAIGLYGRMDAFGTAAKPTERLDDFDWGDFKIKDEDGEAGGGGILGWVLGAAALVAGAFALRSARKPRKNPRRKRRSA